MHLRPYQIKKTWSSDFPHLKTMKCKKKEKKFPFVSKMKTMKKKFSYAIKHDHFVYIDEKHLVNSIFLVLFNQ